MSREVAYVAKIPVHFQRAPLTAGRSARHARDMDEDDERLRGDPRTAGTRRPMSRDPVRMRPRGRPSAPKDAIVGHVAYLQRLDPTRQLESIVAEVAKHHGVERATVFTAMREYKAWWRREMGPKVHLSLEALRNLPNKVRLSLEALHNFVIKLPIK
jgi:hypothetical protein